MFFKKLSLSSADKVINAAAEYYRDNPGYLYLADAMDAKDWIIKNVGPNIRDIMALGHSYEYRGNYLIACDSTKLQAENEKLFEETFSMFKATLAQLRKENDNVMFICMIIPSKGYVDSTTIKAVHKFVDLYRGKYIIITDAPHEKDIKYFSESSGFRTINVNGLAIWRWRT